MRLFKPPMLDCREVAIQIEYLIVEVRHDDGMRQSNHWNANDGEEKQGYGHHLCLYANIKNKQKYERYKGMRQK